jgi:hypothetical protein
MGLYRSIHFRCGITMEAMQHTLNKLSLTIMRM